MSGAERAGNQYACSRPGTVARSIEDACYIVAAGAGLQIHPQYVPDEMVDCTGSSERAFLGTEEARHRDES